MKQTEEQLRAQGEQDAKEANRAPISSRSLYLLLAYGVLSLYWAVHGILGLLDLNRPGTGGALVVVVLLFGVPGFLITVFSLTALFHRH